MQLMVDNMDVVKLTAYAFGILVLGIVLWRLSAAFGRRKAKPKGSKYFGTGFSKQWKKRD